MRRTYVTDVAVLVVVAVASVASALLIAPRLLLLVAGGRWDAQAHLVRVRLGLANPNPKP